MCNNAGYFVLFPSDLDVIFISFCNKAKCSTQSRVVFDFLHPCFLCTIKTTSRVCDKVHQRWRLFLHLEEWVGQGGRYRRKEVGKLTVKRSETERIEEEINMASILLFFCRRSSY